MKRSGRRLKRSEFLSAMRTLHFIAKRHGATLHLRKRKACNYGDGRPNWGRSEGYWELRRGKSKCQVIYYGRASYSAILFVAAHEVRHAIHYDLDLFKARTEINRWSWGHALCKNDSRIEKLISRIVLFLLPTFIFRLPCIRLAHEAELDCDRWAKDFLESIGTSYSYHQSGMYPLITVSSYKLHAKWLAEYGKREYAKRTKYALMNVNHSPFEYSELQAFKRIK